MGGADDSVGPLAALLATISISQKEWCESESDDASREPEQVPVGFQNHFQAN